MSNRMLTIGFSNLDESMPSVAYRRATLEDAAARYPNVRLIVRDNDLDDQRALANVEEFASLPVDLAIIFHINERLGPQLYRTLSSKRIPIITVDIPIPLTVYFGADNRRSGHLAGNTLGDWIRAHWDGQVDRVLVMAEQRALSTIRERIDWLVQGLRDTIPVDPSTILYLDSGHSREMSAQRAHEVLARWADFRHIAILGVNDDTALGVLDAARELGREADVAIVGQGADQQARDEIERPGSPFIATADYHFEQYGSRLMDLALRMLAGERVPPRNTVEHTVVTDPSKW